MNAILRIVPSLCFAALLFPAFANSTSLITTNLSDLAASNAVQRHPAFHFSGIVLDSYDSPAIYSDGTAVIFPKANFKNSCLKPGDRITLTRNFKSNEPSIQSIAVITNGPLPSATPATPGQIQSGQFANRFVAVNGIISDLFQDDIDSHFIYFIIADGTEQCYAAIPKPLISDTAKRQLLGAKVRVRGICQSPEQFLRPYMGCNIRCLNTEPIMILEPAASTPQDVTKLSIPAYSDPRTISNMGLRRIEGSVLAVCSDRSFVLKDNAGKLHRISLRSDQTLPAYGDQVIVAGLVRTDFYLINLIQASCMTVGHATVANPTAIRTSPAKILFNDRHEEQAMPQYYGKLITIEGVVTRPRATTYNDRNLYLDCNQLIIPIDVEGAGIDPHQIRIGSRVAATGICLMDISNWSDEVQFSRIKGFSVAVRTSADIQVLSSPPWLTIYRAVIIALILFTLLLGAIVWNRTLQRQVRRRSLELLRAKAAKDRSELKTEERTRLAIELHDSLSQNLAGIGCQLVATRQAICQGPAATENRLKTVENMLLSTRVELKRCLFDLRNDALEETNFETAIRKTIAPVAANVPVSIRFQVPRSRLDDSHAHTILSVICELCTNAICHGHATNIKIAGCSDRDQVLFSVRDNGSGFDPRTCAGPAEGHFGLSGIRARIRKLNGELTFESNMSTGTNANITISLR